MKISSIWKNLLIASVSLVVSLFAADFVLGLFASRMLADDLGELGANSVRFNEILRYDPLLGWEIIPSGVIRQGEPARSYTHNSSGLRNVEVPFAAPPNVRRVLFSGDSQVYGFEVEDSETIPAQFTSLYRERGLEGINLGVAGYGPDQSLLRLATLGTKFSYEYVVFIFFPDNDFEDANSSKSSNAPKPRFALRGDALCLANVPVPHEDRWAFERMTLDRGSAPLATRILPNLATFLRGRQLRPELAGLIPGITSPYLDALEIVKRDIAPLCPSETPFPSDPLLLPVKLVSEMQRIVTSRGARFLVIEKPLREIERGSKAQELLPSFAREMKKRGIQYFDLAAHFRERSLSETDVFLGYHEGTDNHLGPRGNREIAAITRDWIDSLEHSGSRPGLEAGHPAGRDTERDEHASTE